MNLQSRHTWIILFFSAIAVRIVLYYLTRYTVDDACITFRYAENLAAGDGFVYNLGERVLGTTTPLFTLLLAIANLVGLSSVTAALMINCAASGITTWILAKWSQMSDLNALSFMAPLLYVLFPRNVISDACGMETGFFTALIICAVFASCKKRHGIAIVLAGLAVLTRPEGAIILGVVGVMSLRDHRRLFVGSFLVAATLIVGWALFAYFYFGSPIPNSIAAKSALYAGYERFSFWQNLKIALTLSSPAGWLLWFLFLIGTIARKTQNQWSKTISLIVLIYLAVLLISAKHLFFWYSAPLYPFVFLVAAVTLKRTVSLTVKAGYPRFEKFMPVMIGVGVVAFAVYNFSVSIAGLNLEMRQYEDYHVTPAKYLAQHAGASERVVAEDIGYFGYHFRGNIIDRDGLVTPQVIPYNRRRLYKEFVDSVAPDWLYIDPNYPTSQEIMTDSLFTKTFELIPFDTTGSPPCHQLYRRH